MQYPSTPDFVSNHWYGGWGQVKSISFADVDNDKRTVAATSLVPGKELFDSLTLNASSSREMEENVVSSRRYSPFLNSIAKDSAYVIRQGVVGQDLFGNFSADITIEANAREEKVYVIKGLFNESGNAVTDIARIEIERCSRKVATKNIPISAEFSASAIRRTVLANADTAIEGDDKVAFQPISSTSETVALVSEYDLTRNAYRIGLQLPEGNKYLGFSVEDTNEGDAIFSSESVAISFVKWLRVARTETVKGHNLGLQGGIVPYKSNMAGKLKVFLCKDPSAASCSVLWE